MSQSRTDFILEVRGLTKDFNGFRAVNKVDLKIRTGTVHALIGPNGAGKSTVFNLITKFLEPTAGEIKFKGADITKAPPETLASKGMVRSFQISSIFPGLTVFENIRIALQRQNGLVYHFWQSKSSFAKLAEEVDELLESVHLHEYSKNIAGELSYGRKRALEFATTLALKPEFILLDEPMAGLGIEDIDQISELIQINAKTKTVLMVEHNLSVVRQLSDMITVLARGEVLVEGSYASVCDHPLVMEAYLGTIH